MQSDAESILFDKQFYNEVLNRGWRQRAQENDWTWGGNNRGVMMLNTDICLRYDIDTESPPCCTNINENCRDNSIQNIQCVDSSVVRPDAFEAFNEFAAGNNNDNAAFFSAFSPAWVKATENGHDSLNELVDTCGDTVEPTSNPSRITEEPSSNPTGLTEEPSSNPTGLNEEEPTSNPSASCSDVDRFRDKNGIKRICSWVADRGKCGKFSRKCPVTCNTCPP